MVRIALMMMLVSQAPENDIDAFMAKVLARRDVNWDQYYEYFGKERTELIVEGSLPGVPLMGFRKEFLWFVRDGYMVCSPVSVDGVEISADVRAREEEKWIERLEKKERERNPDREGFMGFKFEPGNYFYAGKKTFEGQELLAVERNALGQSPWRRTTYAFQRISSELLRSPLWAISNSASALS